MFGVPVMRLRLKIEVWDSGLGFKFGIQVSDSRWDGEFGIQG